MLAQKSVDLAGLFLFVPFVILLMVGIIPFTAVSVGLGLLLSQAHLKLTWKS